MKSILAERLGLRYPLIQAPMAGISTAAMAAAAASAGALGSIAAGAIDAEQTRKLVQETRLLMPDASRPLCINLFCHRPARHDPMRDQRWIDHLMPYFHKFGGEPVLPLKEIYQSFVTDTAMQSCLEQIHPEAVSFHFGLPSSRVINKLKAQGIFTLATATNMDEARQIEAAGIDAIVAQGVEAGGHRGTFDPPDSGQHSQHEQQDQLMETLALVRLLVRQCSLPVIAAGGIMDGAGIAAARALGADAVQLGTAFLLSSESAASAAYRAALKSPQAGHTRLTRAISGRAARGIVNRFIHETSAADMPGSSLLPSAYPVAYDAGKQLHALASRQGSQEFAAFWAGQGAALIREGSVAQIIAELIREQEQAETALISQKYNPCSQMT